MSECGSIWRLVQNMRRYRAVCCGKNKTEVSINIRRLLDWEGYGVIQKRPEHTAGQAISALICKKARISDYQYMVLWWQSKTLPIVKLKINYTYIR